MADLRAAVEAAGYAGVSTFLQSGNMILKSDRPPTELEADLERLLAEAFRIQIDVFVRTAADLDRVIAAEPFGKEADDPSRLQVSFLRAAPDAEGVAVLERGDFDPERVVVAEREIYTWHPGGVARSDLAKLIGERTLGVSLTARNWRTVLRATDLVGTAGT